MAMWHRWTFPLNLEYGKRGVFSSSRPHFLFFSFFASVYIYIVQLMSTGMEEETVDWGDVEAATGEGKIDASASGGGDDVISLGGAEDLEEEEEVPAVEIAANGKKQIDDDEPAAIVVEKIPSAPSKPLPAGWKLQEARSGGVYYFNTVTGKTTWDFPTEDAKTSVKEKLEKAETTPAPEKLAGIQIRGAARGNNSAPISEEEALAPNKKREAETSAKEEVDAVDNNSQSEHTFWMKDWLGIIATFGTCLNSMYRGAMGSSLLNPAGMMERCVLLE